MSVITFLVPALKDAKVMHSPECINLTVVWKVPKIAVYKYLFT
jgi:hypothetical protein